MTLTRFAARKNSPSFHFTPQRNSWERKLHSQWSANFITSSHNSLPFNLGALKRSSTRLFPLLTSSPYSRDLKAHTPSVLVQLFYWRWVSLLWAARAIFWCPFFSSRIPLQFHFCAIYRGWGKTLLFSLEISFSHRLNERRKREATATKAEQAKNIFSFPKGITRSTRVQFLVGVIIIRGATP